MESATTDPENPYVLLRHAACAAAEKPLGPADVPLFGDVLPELAILVEAGQLRRAAGVLLVQWLPGGGREHPHHRGEPHDPECRG